MLIDDDCAVGIGRDARPIELQTGVVWAAAGGYQKAVCLDEAVVGLEPEAFTVMLDPRWYGVEQHADALGFEGLLETLAESRVLLRHQGRSCEHGDLGAEPAEALSELEGNKGTADDGKTLRHLPGHQSFGRGPVRGVGETGDVGHEGARPGGDEDAVRGQTLFGAIVGSHHQGAGVFKGGEAAQELDIRVGLEDALVLGVAQLLDQPLLLGDHRPAVDDRAGPADAVKGVSLLSVGGVRAAEKDLGRHATDVDAGAADGAGLDHGDLGAFLDGANGGGKGPGA